MAIGLRGTNTGSSTNSTSATCTLPASMAAGDVTVIAYMQAMAGMNGAGASTTPTLTGPAGWTVIHNGGGVLVCWRAWQSGDTTTPTCTSNTTLWWESISIAYTGLDTTAPVDAYAALFSETGDGTFATTSAVSTAPSVNPNYAGSRLLVLNTCGGSTGRTLTTPTGLTARVGTAVGPNLRFSDVDLVDGTATGNYDSTVGASVINPKVGVSIALKASGAVATTAVPAVAQIAASYQQINNVANENFDLKHLGVQDKDLVYIIAATDSAITPPSGFDTQSGNSGAQTFTKTWSTGDSTALSFAHTVSHYCNFWIGLVRKQGSGTYRKPLHIVAFGSDNANAGTWSSVTAGVTWLMINVTGPSLRVGYKQSADTPTTQYSATLTATGTVNLDNVTALNAITANNPAVLDIKAGRSSGSGSATGFTTVQTYSTGVRRRNSNNILRIMSGRR